MKQITIIILTLIIATTSAFAGGFRVVPEHENMWIIEHYVDDIGGETDLGYITNSGMIQGLYKLSEFNGGVMFVRIMTEETGRIYIQFYRDLGVTPAFKVSEPTTYALTFYCSNVHILRDGGRKRFGARAVNYSDRLELIDSHSNRAVHSILMRGGSIRFKIWKEHTPSTIFTFTINDADGYASAYKKLIESVK